MGDRSYVLCCRPCFHERVGCRIQRPGSCPGEGCMRAREYERAAAGRRWQPPRKGPPRKGPQGQGPAGASGHPRLGRGQHHGDTLCLAARPVNGIASESRAAVPTCQSVFACGFVVSRASSPAALRVFPAVMAQRGRCEALGVRRALAAFTRRGATTTTSNRPPLSFRPAAARKTTTATAKRQKQRHPGAPGYNKAARARRTPN